jgi:hypothetical protein
VLWPQKAGKSQNSLKAQRRLVSMWFVLSEAIGHAQRAVAIKVW